MVVISGKIIYQISCMLPKMAYHEHCKVYHNSHWLHIYIIYIYIFLSVYLI